MCMFTRVYTNVQYSPANTRIQMSIGHCHCERSIQHLHLKNVYVHTCVYKCTVLTCKYTYTDVYRTLPLRETHSASALKECVCSHVCIQMYSTHLQIHVDVHRNFCKHQFCHCMTPIEHLHVKNVHVCVHVYTYIDVCI